MNIIWWGGNIITILAASVATWPKTLPTCKACISSSLNSSVIPEWNHLTLSCSSCESHLRRNLAPAWALAQELKKTRNFGQGWSRVRCFCIINARLWCELTGDCILWTAKKIFGWSVDIQNMEVSSHRWSSALSVSTWSGGSVAVLRCMPIVGFWVIIYWIGRSQNRRFHPTPAQHEPNQEQCLWGY